MFVDGLGYFHSDGCGDVIIHHMIVSAVRTCHAILHCIGGYAWEDMARASYDGCSYPTWAEGLKKSGLYYDGFVDDIESVLEQHRKDTVTFYGTRNSSGAGLDKENVNSLDSEVHVYFKH